MVTKKEEAYKLACLVADIKSYVDMAKELADEHGLSFSLNFGDATNVNRCVGGTYYGKGSKMCVEDAAYLTDEWSDPVQVEEMDNVKDWEDYEDIEEVTLKESVLSAWQSSSEQC
jgi:hypothetical protein